MKFTYETVVTVEAPEHVVHADWSDLSSLPQILTHIRATARGDEDDLGRMVVMLVGSHVEFAAQRTMCASDTICWQNLGHGFEYILTVTIRPDGCRTAVTVNCTYDPPGVIPDIMESLGFNRSFRRDLDHDLARYGETFVNRSFRKSEPVISPLGAAVAAMGID